MLQNIFELGVKRFTEDRKKSEHLSKTQFLQKRVKWKDSKMAGHSSKEDKFTVVKTKKIELFGRTFTRWMNKCATKYVWYEDEQAHLASYSDVLDDKKDIKDVKDGENEKHIGATDLLHRAGNLVVDQAALFQPLSLQWELC